MPKVSHTFEGPGRVVNGLTGIKRAMVKCLFTFSCG